MGKERYEGDEDVGLVADHRARVPEDMEKSLGGSIGGWELDWTRGQTEG